MDITHRTCETLLERANTDVLALIRRFENILSLAPVGPRYSDKDENHEPGDLVEPPDDTCHPSQRAIRDRNVTAMEAYRMEVETAALVRAAEDILLLTRSMKEAWLFGQLDTIGKSEAEDRTEAHARAVAKALEQLMEKAGEEEKKKKTKKEKPEAAAHDRK